MRSLFPLPGGKGDRKYDACKSDRGKELIQSFNFFLKDRIHDLAASVFVRPSCLQYASSVFINSSVMRMFRTFSADRLGFSLCDDIGTTILLEWLHTVTTKCSLVMGKFLDLTGQKFARLFVLKPSSFRRANRVTWDCLCDCGKEVSITSNQLKLGKTQSCGCYRRNVTSFRKTVHGAARKDAKTAEYLVWKGIRTRCNNKNDKSYARYGGRGIKLCDRWQFYENFIADMGIRPSNKHSIERKNNNGNYEPENCCWATNTEQQRNKNSNRILEFNFQSKTLAEWAEITQIPYNAIRLRLSRGWTIKEALTIPSGSRVKRTREKL